MIGKDGIPASWLDDEDDPDLAGDTSGSNALDTSTRGARTLPRRDGEELRYAQEQDDTVAEAAAPLSLDDTAMLQEIWRRRVATASRKLYVWPKRGFLAVAYATSLAEARTLLLDEMGGTGSDGSMPCVARAFEAVEAHQPQVFAYGSTAEFVVTESGWLEAEQKASAELLRAAENLYAFVEAFGSDFLTSAGRVQVAEAYEVLRQNGSKMFFPAWEEGRVGR